MAARLLADAEALFLGEGLLKRIKLQWEREAFRELRGYFTQILRASNDPVNVLAVLNDNVKPADTKILAAPLSTHAQALRKRDLPK